MGCITRITKSLPIPAEGVRAILARSVLIAAAGNACGLSCAQSGQCMTETNNCGCPRADGGRHLSLLGQDLFLLCTFTVLPCRFPDSCSPTDMSCCQYLQLTNSFFSLAHELLFPLALQIDCVGLGSADTIYS